MLFYSCFKKVGSICFVVGVLFGSYPAASENLPVASAGPITISLGGTNLKLIPPVKVDGRWVRHDTVGKELSLNIPVKEFYRNKFQVPYDVNVDKENFYLSISYVPNADSSRRAKEELQYAAVREWVSVESEPEFGLVKYVAIESRSKGWGSPTYFPISPDYKTPDGLPLRISCNYASGASMKCRFFYFIKSDLVVMFMFNHAETHLKDWQVIDAALRKALADYIGKKEGGEK
jgi:hypothetical protein